MYLKKAAGVSHHVFKGATYALSACGLICAAAVTVAAVQALRIDAKTVKIGRNLVLSETAVKIADIGDSRFADSYIPKIEAAPVLVELNAANISKWQRTAPSYRFSKEVFENAPDTQAAVEISGIQKNEISDNNLNDLVIVVQEYEPEEDFDRSGLMEVLTSKEPTAPTEKLLRPIAKIKRPEVKIGKKIPFGKVSIQNPKGSNALNSQTRKPTVKTVAIQSAVPLIAKNDPEKIQDLTTESKLEYSQLVAMFSDDGRQTLSDADPIPVQPIQLNEIQAQIDPHSYPDALLALAKPTETNTDVDTQRELKAATEVEKPASVPVIQPIPILDSQLSSQPLHEGRVVVTLPSAKPAPTAAPDLSKEEDTRTKEEDLTELASASSQLTARKVEPATIQGQQFQLRVVDAFDTARTTLSSVKAQVLGTAVFGESFSDGTIVFSDVTIQGVLPIVLTKEGYLGRKIDLKQNYNEIELVSENSARMISEILGQPFNTDQGVVAGIVTDTESNPVAGIQVALSSVSSYSNNAPAELKANYFSDAGVPNREYIVTSANGRFVFLNVPSGTYLMTMRGLDNREFASRLFHVSSNEGIMRKFSIGQLKTVRGRVINAAANQPVAGAKIRLLGQPMESEVESKRTGGFAIESVYVDCSELNYLQVAKNGYYHNRIDFNCDAFDRPKNVYVLPAASIDGDALSADVSLNEHTGVVVGHISSKSSSKVQLWGPDEMNPQQTLRGRDYYYGRDGVLRPDLDKTTTSGRFTIFDAPIGLSYLQTLSPDGEYTLSYWPIMISPSTVNVYLQ